MTERPILFSAPMVRAILDGRKTQTRRVVKRELSGRVKAVGSPRNWHLDDPNAVLACPYGQPGDRLWVRETFNWSSERDLLPREPHKLCRERAGYLDNRVVWAADGTRVHPEFGKAVWRPSIHMPRWASRITLEVTAVRVERLNDISEADAIAEGCAGWGWHDPFSGDADGQTPQEEYAQLWEKINGAGSWDANPWVWIVEFRAAGGE